MSSYQMSIFPRAKSHRISSSLLITMMVPSLRAMVLSGGSLFSTTTGAEGGGAALIKGGAATPLAGPGGGAVGTGNCWGGGVSWYGGGATPGCTTWGCCVGGTVCTGPGGEGSAGGGTEVVRDVFCQASVTNFEIKNNMPKKFIFKTDQSCHIQLNRHTLWPASSHRLPRPQSHILLLLLTGRLLTGCYVDHGGPAQPGSPLEVAQELLLSPLFLLPTELVLRQLLLSAVVFLLLATQLLLLSLKLLQGVEGRENKAVGFSCFSIIGCL